MMDFNKIDLTPIRPGWGYVWQGGSVDQAIETLPGPLLVVCMDRGEINETWINHQSIEAVLAVWIDDSATACLKDGVLLGLVRTIVAWLAAGGDAYIHCAAGVSRSSYMDCAVHMAALKVGFDHALAIIRAQRPVADPNAGFVAHLRRLEPQLLAVNP